MNNTLPGGEILIYKAEDGQVKLEIKLEEETLWLTQQMIAELFQTSVPNINMHIKNIIEEGELDAVATIKDFLIVREEGARKVQRKLSHYSLDMIIAVGYRVKSLLATRFRIWATQQLNEYLLKGFVMDDERLANPPIQGTSPMPDRFSEMLERIRDIRASERRMYLRVKEIFVMAADYEPGNRETTFFFQTIQNKLHFTVTGLTAAELIYQRVNPALANMGLTSWKADNIHKSDIRIAKNYLNEHEITELNRIVTMWLDYAEDQAIRRKQVFLTNWEDKLDQFLQFNDRKILPDTGKVPKKQADAKALESFEIYSERQREIKESKGLQETFDILDKLGKKGEYDEK